MKKHLGFLVILVSVLSSGCSNLALKKEWQERGYTESEINTIEPYRKSYMNMLGSGGAGSTFGSSLENGENQKRVRNIFCSCVKKLDTKCQKKPEGLTGSDLDLWAKANAAEMALRQYSSINKFGSFNTSVGAVDPAECL